MVSYNSVLYHRCDLVKNFEMRDYLVLSGLASIVTKAGVPNIQATD